MATLSRELLLRVNSEGTKEVAKNFDDLNKSIDGVSTSSKRMSDREIAESQRYRIGIQDRIRQSKAYQAVNENTNGQLDEMYTRTQSILDNLRSMVNIKTAPLATGLGYVAYQLGTINSAGRNVNLQLDSMGIKLAATIKQSKNLSSVSAAQKASGEYIQYARQFAATTPFEQTEVIGAMSNLAPIVKGDMKKIKSMLNAAAVLAQIDPEQGFEGAVYALREAASGSTNSLSQRFELSKTQLNAAGVGRGGDIGEAVLKALKQNGQTLEMVQQFATTVEGMQSNMDDSRNYIAGNFNKPIFEQQKRGMYFRMQQQQMLGAPQGGLDTSMSALGQGFALGGTIKNLAYQSMMRPFNIQRTKLLETLAPGMIKARYALEEKATKLEVNDLLSRFDSLDTVEKQRLVDLRQRLREIPLEAARADREANSRLLKQGEYIAKVLGMNPAEKKRLITWMQDISKNFSAMVDRVKKTFDSKGVQDFMDKMKSLTAGFVKLFIKFPQDIWNGLNKAGVLRQIQNTFTSISESLTEVGKVLFGNGFQFAKNSTDILAGAAKLFADAIVTALWLLKPVLFVVKELMSAVLWTVKWTAKIAGGIINGLMSALAWVGRHTGMSREDNLKNDIAAAETKLALSQAETAGEKNPIVRKNAEMVAAQQQKDIDRMKMLLNKEQDPKQKNWIDKSRDFVSEHAGKTAATLIGFGIVKNIKNVFQEGAAAASGLGILGRIGGGLGALGKGAIRLLPGANVGIRESFKAGNLLTGRGVGGMGMGAAINLLFPGTPVAFVFNLVSTFRFLFDVIKMIGPWSKGLWNMLKLGVTDIPAQVMKWVNRISGIVRGVGKGFQFIGKVFNALKVPQRVATIPERFMGSLAKDLRLLSTIWTNFQAGLMKDVRFFGRLARAVPKGAVDFVNYAKGIGRDLVEVAKDVGGAIKNGYGLLKNSRVAQAVESSVKAVVNFVKGTARTIGQAPQRIGQIFMNIFDMVKNSKFIQMFPRLLKVFDPIRNFISKFFAGGLKLFQGIGPLIQRGIAAISKLPIVGRFLAPVIEAIAGALGVVGTGTAAVVGAAASSVASTGIAAYQTTRYAMSRANNVLSAEYELTPQGIKKTHGGNESADDYVQFQLLKTAVEHHMGMGGISAEDLKKQYDQEMLSRDEAGYKLSPEEIKQRRDEADRANQKNPETRKAIEEAKARTAADRRGDRNQGQAARQDAKTTSPTLAPAQTADIRPVVTPPPTTVVVQNTVTPSPAAKPVTTVTVTRNRENAAKQKGSDGKRHFGGMIGKSGSYTLQAGEYVLPAGGFDFSKYSKSEKGGAAKEETAPTVAKRLTEILANANVLTASIRYVDAILRLMGVDPRKANQALNGAGGGGGNQGTPDPQKGFIPGITTNAQTGEIPQYKGQTKTDNINQERKAKFMHIYNLAKQAGDAHPEVTAAQWALESSWGKSASGKNNLFGVKAVGNQKGSNVVTHEQGPNGLYETTQKFRDYDSELDSIKDRVRLAKTPRYEQAGYGTARTAYEAIQALKNGGYAGDDAYVKNVADVIAGMGINPNATNTSLTKNTTNAINAQAQKTPGGQVGASVSISTGAITINPKTVKDGLKQFDEAVAIQRKELSAKLSGELRN